MFGKLHLWVYALRIKKTGKYWSSVDMVCKTSLDDKIWVEIKKPRGAKTNQRKWRVPRQTKVNVTEDKGNKDNEDGIESKQKRRRQEIKEMEEKAGCLGEISEEIMGDISSLLDEEKI